jgi:arylsulfatase
MRLGVIVLDTLRNDVPEDALSSLRNSADHVFSSFYSTARWTSPAHASLFTGYYPTEVGTHANQRHLTTSKLTLAEFLQKQDYETVAASNNINVDHFFDFDRGFGIFERGPGI